MLDGWLAAGSTGEGHRAGAAAGRRHQGAGARGVRTIPKATPARPRAMVIAVKPQVATDALPPLAALAAHDRRRLDHGRARRSASWNARLPKPRSCAPCPTRRPRSAAASLSRSAMRRQRRARDARAPPSRRHRHGGMDRRRSADGCGDGRVRLGPRLRLSAGGKPRPRRHRAGLPPDLAAKLARETVAGSGELLHRSRSIPPTSART